MQALNFLSLITSPIKVVSATGALLGPATGFFYGRDSDWIYLVTNWHVVTGRNPCFPKESRYGAVPVALTLTLHRKVSENRISLSQKIEYRLEINNEDGSEPKWYEHSQYRRMIDIVVLKIPRGQDFDQEVQYNCLQEYNDFEESFLPRPMDQVFVIGYPWGLTGGDSVLPLYKRGNVASEPIAGHANLPRFLIDCRTAEGMSGAPVICSHSGIWDPNGEGGVLSADGYIGTVENFAGVYSGRLKTGDEKLEDRISDIGVVWKEEAVRQIVSDGVEGTKLQDFL